MACCGGCDRIFPRMSPPSAVIEARELVRTFGRRRAVDRVDLTIDAGDALALFGPNGAGKTTLLRLLAGLLKPTSGSVRIGGASVRGDESARGRVGLVSHHTLLYTALTARENVEFAARLYGVPDRRAAAEQALSALQDTDRADSPVHLAEPRDAATGVVIARAIVHRPAVVLADEPYTGLDAIGAAALTEMLQGLRRSGAALVLVTHNVNEGLALATHAAIMLGGRIVRHQPSGDADAARYAADYQLLLLSPPDATERVA